MIIAEFKTKRITFDSLKPLLVENELSEKFLELVVLNLLPLRIFLTECLKKDYEIDKIELFHPDNNINKIKFGIHIKDQPISKLLTEFKYLSNNDDNLIFFSDSYYYSKDLFNYDPEKLPYIKPEKLLVK